MKLNCKLLTINPCYNSSDSERLEFNWHANRQPTSPQAVALIAHPAT
ncbi:hypothetical protein [Kamptonema formosum]|nr:hypothetical protein [Oscillatoria sp. PCC 10802]